MTTDVPEWLSVMRAITGLTETPGDADNPKILGMRNYIARKYPDMADYCDLYAHDETPWCGLTVAFCTSVADVRPVYGPTDTDRWMWALAWSEDWAWGQHLSRPVLGCIVVTEREGGGHVTLFEYEDEDMFYCRGGNQSDAVNVKAIDPDTVVALVWPRAAGQAPEVIIPIEDRPVLERGDAGTDVADLQMMLPRGCFSGAIDGDFGAMTEDGVKKYQVSRGLDVDGVVGQQTWNALYQNKPPIPLPEPPPDALSLEDREAIMEIANTSAIASYSWEDRGQAPRGYTQGMALAFAQTYLKLKENHPAALEMAKARTDSDKDALNVYQDDFSELDMSNERDGPDVLRHLYALMLGQGMRESSGQHCCGRDQSASNVQSETCETGLFQTSYNAAGASNPEFDRLMDEYATRKSPGYLPAFAEDVSCSSEDWSVYGSGRGAEFQMLCKVMPAFAVESCALTLRNLCNHYGPVVRHEVELKRAADEMFRAVQEYVDGIVVSM
jgi:uncharacterized protein (TIGR02594 family)